MTDKVLDCDVDSTGEAFSLAGCTHAYTYDGSGNLTVDVATWRGASPVVRTKTYTYNGSNQLTAESLWVRS